MPKTTTLGVPDFGPGATESGRKRRIVDEVPATQLWRHWEKHFPPLKDEEVQVKEEDVPLHKGWSRTAKRRGLRHQWGGLLPVADPLVAKDLAKPAFERLEYLQSLRILLGKRYGGKG
ncbi:hypothetical protein EAI_12365 [Harpegnathos saltator]|uniref:Uncharacterized protein n=1 Tax=Harpegnathos saltator TaxID=610380 RepID=E2BYD1_HARSA|nr:hypothetical protein EAI_12365 [Harpegnathos saltator]